MTILHLIFSLFLTTRLLHVFFGFTFTDTEDFMPLLSLVLGLGAAVSISFFSKGTTSKVLMACMGMLCMWPLLPHVGLYLMARELQHVGVRWPQVMVDDPKIGSVMQLLVTMRFLMP